MQCGTQSKIVKLINLHCQNLKKIGLMKHPVVPADMVDGPEDEEGWIPWKLVDSKLTNNDIQILENEIGYKLPKLFKDLLCYKHYLELDFQSITFLPFPSDDGCSIIRSWLIDKSEQYGILKYGYAIFGTHSDDESYYCFSLKESEFRNGINEQDCPIVIIDPLNTSYKNIIRAFQSFSSMVDSLINELT